MHWRCRLPKSVNAVVDAAASRAGKVDDQPPLVVLVALGDHPKAAGVYWRARATAERPEDSTVLAFVGYIVRYGLLMLVSGAHVTAGRPELAAPGVVEANPESTPTTADDVLREVSIRKLSQCPFPRTPQQGSHDFHEDLREVSCRRWSTAGQMEQLARVAVLP